MLTVASVVTDERIGPSQCAPRRALRGLHGVRAEFAARGGQGGWHATLAKAHDGPMRSTIGEALAAATQQLRRDASPTPRLDAEVLLAHAIDRDRSWLLAHPEATIETGPFDALVARRAAGEPVAYIRGFKDWHSLRIRTDPRALIPRPETELLADAAAEAIDRRLMAGAPTVAWDVGTGSGAIAVVLAARFADALADGRLRLVASDVSSKALALAAENLAQHGLEGVELRTADLLAGPGPRPDIVTANLPYVASAEVDEQRGSIAFEPRAALDGGPDGLDVVRRLVAMVPDRVAAGGSVLLEVGAGQASAVAAMAPAGASVSTLPDLAGIKRVVRLDLPD